MGWIPEPGTGASTSDIVVVSGEADSGDVIFPYGVDTDGNPYHLSTGVPLAEAARLFIDTTDDTFYLEELT